MLKQVVYMIEHETTLNHLSFHIGFLSAGLETLQYLVRLTELEVNG